MIVCWPFHALSYVTLPTGLMGVLFRPHKCLVQACVVGNCEEHELAFLSVYRTTPQPFGCLSTFCCIFYPVVSETLNFLPF